MLLRLPPTRHQRHLLPRASWKQRGERQAVQRTDRLRGSFLHPEVPGGCYRAPETLPRAEGRVGGRTPGLIQRSPRVPSQRRPVGFGQCRLGVVIQGGEYDIQEGFEEDEKVWMEISECAFAQNSSLLNTLKSTKSVCACMRACVRVCVLVFACLCVSIHDSTGNRNSPG